MLFAHERVAVALGLAIVIAMPLAAASRDGEEAAPFTLKELSGHSVSLADLHGSIIVMHFAASVRIMRRWERCDPTSSRRDVSGLLMLARGLGATWPFVSHEKRIVQRELEIAEYTDLVHDRERSAHALPPDWGALRSRRA